MPTRNAVFGLCNTGSLIEHVCKYTILSQDPTDMHLMIPQLKTMINRAACRGQVRVIHVSTPDNMHTHIFPSWVENMFYFIIYSLDL